MRPKVACDCCEAPRLRTNPLFQSNCRPATTKSKNISLFFCIFKLSIVVEMNSRKLHDYKTTNLFFVFCSRVVLQS